MIADLPTWLRCWHSLHSHVRRHNISRHRLLCPLSCCCCHCVTASKYACRSRCVSLHATLLIFAYCASASSRATTAGCHTAYECALLAVNTHSIASRARATTGTNSAGQSTVAALTTALAAAIARHRMALVDVVAPRAHSTPVAVTTRITIELEAPSLRSMPNNRCALITSRVQSHAARRANSRTTTSSRSTALRSVSSSHAHTKAHPNPPEHPR
jgi:hypothetical protein